MHFSHAKKPMLHPFPLTYELSFHYFNPFISWWNKFWGETSSLFAWS